ncbi:hypothetical protein A3I34_00390 [Candidatus Jorgensenbacteria bacterium RIFCSPLOWO2_02_FULL_45_12]|uniref:Uncharacterized protein n=2 Tax=Candidatus Joergenseniibacteriota TaxID=1752739 RepID=A0A1F6BPN2_9BACT|nr:MAG: Transcriptional regulator, TraR/DksA family [Candidatus Jorgensenbacteria bacterium GW2011_GWA2_45_9]OGG38894.1 MAG: hypothetical protein A3D55_02750 [Candidatus Jorgensenbacteria bacterium RIFCSPHIGHO2_02_FULL_45_20]OGG42378.1 MAG: hypothetical protein A3I34_00390 [Candidatus Jorgensenbacteria bacterium RIFCSPLOWO2_02_FULL_45_12]
MPFSKEQLTNWKRAIQNALAEVVKRLNKIRNYSDFGEDLDGPDEEADETEEFLKDKGIESVLSARLGRLDKALDKIEGNTYGKCELCGKEIEAAILDVDPESLFCMNCKKKQ